MVDTSVSSLIQFIASIVVAAAVAGVLVQTVGGVSQAIDDRGADVTDSIRTDIEVISDPKAPVYNESSDELTLLVKNTGTRALPASPEVLDVIVDGAYQTNVTVTVVGEATDWRPFDVARVTVTTGLSSGDHRVVIVTDGDRETFEFRS